MNRVIQQVDIATVIYTGGGATPLRLLALTAFDASGRGICSILHPDQTPGDVIDAVPGSRQETLRTIAVDLESGLSAVHRAMYETAVKRWPDLPSGVKDLRGQQFGRLAVRAFAGIQSGRAYWTVQCTCGSFKHVRGKSLLEGKTVSCGCARADPKVRAAARLSMSAEDRSAAAAGKKVAGKRPPNPPQPKKQERILPFIGDRKGQHGQG